MGLSKMFQLYWSAVQRQRALKAKLAVATGGAGKKLTAIAFRSWREASREKRMRSHAVKTLVRKIWRGLLLNCTRAWREAAAEQAYERKKSNRVETLQEQAKRYDCMLLSSHASSAFNRYSNVYHRRRMNEMTLHAVFYDWVDSFMERREALEEAAGRIFGNSRRLVLRNTFATLHSYAKTRIEAKEKMTKATLWLYRSVLVKVVQFWRADALETAGQKRRVEEKRQQVMYRFSNRCVSMTFSRWSAGTLRRKHVAALAAAALKTLRTSLKKGAFAQLRQNVFDQARQRMHEVSGAIAWSIATPGKIRMWPALLRHASNHEKSAVHVHDLTQDAAVSLAAFGKDNLNNALLQGIMMGAAMTTGDAASAMKHRRRPHELLPLAHAKHAARHMQLRPDSGDDDEEGEDEYCRFQSVTGAPLPLPIGSNILLPHSAPASLPAKKLINPAQTAALAPVRNSSQYVGALSKKQRKVSSERVLGD
jgi:hypothetical protein